MRSKFEGLIIIILVLTFISCNESFSPKDEYEEEYIFNCIIDGRSKFQTATIMSNFDANNFDPESNNSNPFIEGANITLTYLSNEYNFKDTLMYSEVEQRFEGPLKLYYLDGFLPERNDVTLNIKATLPSGKILTAEAQTPISFAFDIENSALQVPPLDNSSNVNIIWHPFSYKYYQYYIARFMIKYELIQNGESIIRKVEVPLEFQEKNGITEPVYPKPSRVTGITYPVVNFEKVLESLAETPLQKDSIAVSRFLDVEILTFDANLAAYYYAGLSENIYTVRLDEINYSNVQGGYGIFGVTWSEKYNIMLSSSFISSFGYDVMN